MPLITLFTALKSFDDPQIAMIQNNAIASWAHLADVEILLMGDEAGVGAAAAQSPATHIPQVRRNESGTPLVSSMIDLAREWGGGDLLGIINADMILMSDFVSAAKRMMAWTQAFVLLGRRWDLDVDAPIEFKEGWEDSLRISARERGTLHRPAGSDYFLFPRSCYKEVPDFAVGRAGWDNWMIFKARRERWIVVDGTPSILAIHQNHSYDHLPGGEPHYAVPESDENIRLAGGEASIRYTVLDSTHCLRNGDLVNPDLSYLRFMRGIELFLRTLLFFLPEDMIEEVARPKRWKKRFQKILGRL